MSVQLLLGVAAMNFDRTQAWYHGSPLKLTILREGSTITQKRDLARIFSHKPALVMVSDTGQIKHRRDKILQMAYREIINEKEAQIQRLANDNREWRNYFWMEKGLTEKEILDLSGQPAPSATPITAKEPKTQGKKRRQT